MHACCRDLKALNLLCFGWLHLGRAGSLPEVMVGVAEVLEVLFLVSFNSNSGPCNTKTRSLPWGSL